MTLSNNEAEAGAYEFTKLLVELCGLYYIGPDLIIHDKHGNCLSTKIIDSPEEYMALMVYQIGMVAFKKTVLLQPYKESLGTSNPRKWFFTHLENICAYLTKRIMLTIVNDFVFDKKNFSCKYYDLLHLLDGKADIETLKDIYEIPAERFLSIDYDEKRRTAWAQSDLSSSKTKTKYQSVKQTTWKILEILFNEIFSSDSKNLIQPSEMRDMYTHNATIDKIPETDAKLHVLVDLISMLEPGVHLLDNYNLPVEELRSHLSRLEDYSRVNQFVASTCNLKGINKEIAVLIDGQGYKYPHEYTYYALIEDLKPLIYEITTGSNNALQTGSGFNDAITFYEANDMPTSYGKIQQTPLIVNELGKNELKLNEVLSIKENVEVHIADVISKYIPAAKQDYAGETDAIMKDKIEMNLLMTLEHDKERQKWLPGVKEKGALLTYKGAVINLKEHIYNQVAIQQIAAKYSYTIGPQVPQGYIPWRPFITLYGIVNNCVNKNNVLDDESICRALEDKFDITKNDVYKPVVIPEYSSWLPSDDKTYYKFLYPGCKFIMFKSKNGVLIYGLIRFEANGKSLLLPVTNYVKDNENPASFFVMPVGKAPLLNLDLMKNYKHARIVLTDDVELAYKHGTEYAMSDVIWTSWYGGEAAINNVDWKKLEGRRVYCAFREDDEHLKEKLSIIVKVLKEFGSLPNTYLNIVGIDREGVSKKYRHLSIIKRAKSLKVNIPVELSRKLDGHIDVNPTGIEDEEYIISNIVEAQTLTMIYAPSGLGKTWLSLSIALAVANGVEVFKGWSCPQGAKGVGFFSGEMSTKAIKNRIYQLNHIYKKSDNDNIIARRIYKADLTDKKDQMVIDEYINEFNNESDIKMTLLILDNLNTLAESGTTKKGWGSLFEWIENKKKDGMTVILVHHPNKDGKYYGTSHIKNNLDLMIYAGEAEDVKPILKEVFKDKEDEIEGSFEENSSDDVVMLLSNEKKRLGPKGELKSCQIQLSNIGTEDICWQIENPEYECLLEDYDFSDEELYNYLEQEYLNDGLTNARKRTSRKTPSTKVSYPQGEDFKGTNVKEQGEIIKSIWIQHYNNTGKSLSTVKIGKKLGLTRGELDPIRTRTETQKWQLEDKYIQFESE